MNMLRANSAFQARGGDQAHPDPVRRVGAGVEVLGEQFLALQVGPHARRQQREFFGA